jgi:hypothetical protein
MIGLLALLGCTGTGPVTEGNPGTVCRYNDAGPVDTGFPEVRLALEAPRSSCAPLVSLTCDLELVRGDIVATGTRVTERPELDCVPTEVVDRVDCVPAIPDTATRIIAYGDLVTEVALLPVCSVQ